MALQLFKIETVEVTSPVSSVTFSNIPQGYTDLILKMSTRTNYAGVGDGLILTINGTTSSFTSTKTLQGNGATASSFNNPSTSDVYQGDTVGANATASTFGNTGVYIPNYTSTSIAKSFSTDHVSENNATTAYAQLTAGLWNPSTQAAITTIKASTLNASSFVANSTFTLYGVL